MKVTMKEVTQALDQFIEYYKQAKGKPPERLVLTAQQAGFLGKIRNPVNGEQMYKNSYRGIPWIIQSE
jgi:hypothetical protein